MNTSHGSVGIVQVLPTRCQPPGKFGEYLTRQCGDCSSPTYSLSATRQVRRIPHTAVWGLFKSYLLAVSHPASSAHTSHGSVGIVQVLPTRCRPPGKFGKYLTRQCGDCSSPTYSLSATRQVRRIPHTAVWGLFKSYLLAVGHPASSANTSHGS